ncbi:hypothetical protein [Bacillus amyloliquefaciens]|uniref:hypothetical protein n=1 Tax=Bacillus amyloliquefaciens TaxID=1390 RepID=UPI00174B2EA0|nr:hypothetical protein [Bacillus amyloliquefaciens]QOE05295.1 hypothetical protein BAMOH1_06045 [Bacillus amyloliquefaciens]QZY33950.1 hypothetical protein BAJP3144_06075 [Bacillus amyloliquefaciens]
MDLADSLGLAIATAILTLIVNILFKLVQNKTDFMVSIKQFKRDHYYKQLNELYKELYAIVCQSEFLRKFHHIDELNSMKEVPFIELAKRIKKIQTNLVTGEEKVIGEDVETAITRFDKKNIIALIMRNKQYASQELLKLAVGYRYCHEYYTKKDLDEIQLEVFQKTELDYIYKIVIRIVMETNEKLKFCKMDFNESERRTGKIDNQIFVLKN